MSSKRVVVRNRGILNCCFRTRFGSISPHARTREIRKMDQSSPRFQSAVANSNALSEYIIDDLRNESPKAIRALTDSGHLVSLKNASISTRVAVRNIDVVLYEHDKLPIISAQMAVEHKTVMTAHGKARLNRYGDIIAYCNHMHNHRSDCVVGATVVINTSETYENPDAFARGLERPKFKMAKVVKDTVQVFERIPLRETPDESNDSPEALTIIVINYDR